jgi:cytochrome P450
MTEDSKLVIIAGRFVALCFSSPLPIPSNLTLTPLPSDTTSITLVHAIYYLILHPQIYTRLQSLLDAIFPNGDSAWTYDAVKSLPYLDAIINETLRLKPPVPSAIHRQTPPEGIWIDEIFVPGDVHVAVPTYALHHDARYWERPEDFWPERWLEEQDGGPAAGAKIVPDAFIPFSIGS